jgi:hypothetical protein
LKINYITYDGSHLQTADERAKSKAALEEMRRVQAEEQERIKEAMRRERLKVRAW